MSLDSIRRKDIGTTNPVPIGKYQKVVNNNASGKQFMNNTGAFENINNMNTVNKQSINNQFDNVKGVKPSWGSSLLDAFRKSDSTVKNVGGAVKNSFSPLVENTKKFINNFKPNANEDKEKTSTSNSQGNTFDNYWEEIHNQIKANSLNSKNEVAMAQRKASQNMDNYLKALGIQNTGLGQSQYTSLASDYANAIADINKNEEQQLLDVEGQKRAEQMELNEKKADQVLAILEAGGNADDYINQLKAEGVDTTFLENYAKTIYDNKAKADEETLEAENKEMINQGLQLHSSLISLLKSSELDENTRKQYQTVADEINEAIINNDIEALEKAYDKAEKLSYGIGEKEVETTETIANKTIDEYLNGTTQSLSLSEIKNAYPEINQYSIELGKGLSGKNTNLFYNGIDDDLDINIGGKNYDLDVDWNSGGPQGVDIEEWTSAQRYLEKYKPQDNELAIYNGRLYFYYAKDGRWGVVQNNVGGKKLLKDFKEAISGNAPGRWSR